MCLCVCVFVYVFVFVCASVLVCLCVFVGVHAGIVACVSVRVRVWWCAVCGGECVRSGDGGGCSTPLINSSTDSAVRCVRNQSAILNHASLRFTYILMRACIADYIRTHP